METASSEFGALVGCQPVSTCTAVTVSLAARHVAGKLAGAPSTNTAVACELVDTQAPVNFAEIIVYDRALSDPERQRIEGYLAAKWHL